MAIDDTSAEDPKPPSSSDGGDDATRAPRLPRWTRQEILVLIQGKRVAESKVRRIRALGPGQVEPKWASVSSYCRMHGVNRGPVQCRKRWSNLAGDYKKIKEWEGQQKSESFWSMRNDLRRERKLPGFFDKEVYDILDGAEAAPAPAPPPPPPEGPTFDSRRGGSAEEGVFSDFEQEEEASPSASGRKRKRAEEGGSPLVEVLEAHNTQIQLDRDQRKAHSDSLLAVLNKLADALVRISDKL